MLQIGARIRQVRLERGLSQGDLEGKTGLLRCYLSRVENGHTEPSLQTLAKLASALEMPLVGFFENGEEGSESGDQTPTAAPRPLNEDEVGFLAEMRRCSLSMSEASRQRVLELAKKITAEAGKSKG